MAYTFELGKSVQENVRHIAETQVDKAISEIDDSDLSTSATVHQIRNRCKKVRGLIRLVRPCLATYTVENAAFRDSAASLSSVRDAEAILKTHDALIEFYADEIDRSAYLTIRHRFLERKESVVCGKGLDVKIACLRDAMTEARKRIDDWHIDGEGVRGGRSRARQDL